MVDLKKTVDAIDSAYWTGRGYFKIAPVEVYDNTVPRKPELDTRSPIEKRLDGLSLQIFGLTVLVIVMLFALSAKH